MKVKRLNPIVLITVLTILALCIVYLVTKKAQAPAPTTPTQSTSPAVNSNPSSPNVQDTTLDECLKRVSNSEAQASLIQEAREACQRQFGQ